MSSSSSSGGIGFFGVLAIVFIVLKILGKISWSWWLVTSPIWVPTAVILAVMAVVFVIAVLS